MSLTIAGITGGGMALYHFVLPYHMGWRNGLVGTPDSIAWAVFALGTDGRIARVVSFWGKLPPPPENVPARVLRPFDRTPS